MSNTNKPQAHPHAELIKAWADGAKIQYKNENNEWITVNPPSWYKNTEYRIKPEEPSARWKPKMGEEYTYLSFDDGFLEWKIWNDSQTDIGRYEIGNELKKTAPSDENFQLDGKPLTDGEKELIKALRLADIRSVIPFENIAIYTNEHGELCNDEATIAFTVWSSDELIRAALEQIQAEQEAGK